MCVCVCVLQGVLQPGFVLYKAEKGNAQYVIPEGTEIEAFRKVRPLPGSPCSPSVVLLCTAQQFMSASSSQLAVHNTSKDHLLRLKSSGGWPAESQNGADRSRGMCLSQRCMLAGRCIGKRELHLIQSQ